MLTELICALALPLLPYPQSVRELPGHVAEVSPTYESDASLGREAYRLRVADGKVVITSSSEAGAFYARQTLSQLRRADGTYPAVEIEDAPAFAWRGVLLDESRHFWGKDVVKDLLDRMAAMKLNVFHWHLTDSHGWRLQIDRYPELTDRGARRPIPDWDFNVRDAADAVGEYGPFFYTKDEVREILAYAKARHIRVIPEIEIPGHSREVILCHPGFSCLDWGTFADMIRERHKVDQAAALCVGNDEVMTFFENVLDEVCELFPDEYVHIGGDECPRGNWKKCPKCQKRMKDEGLKSEDELQAWVTRRFSAYLAGKGRRIVGWDEILAGGLPEGATVMSWRGAAGGIEAAKQGHCAVVCPHQKCYLDYPTGEKDDPCPYPRFCAKTFLPLEKVYSFDPYEGIPADQHRYVLGSQTLNWGESTWTVKDLHYKMWPRTCANAEIVWTGPKKRTFADFRERLARVTVQAAPVPSVARGQGDAKEGAVDLGFLKELVEIPSSSVDYPQVNRAMRAMKAYLEKRGVWCAVETDKAGRELLFAATRPGKEQDFILSAHLDVVPASFEGQYALKEEKGRLTGRGVGDDKGGALAAAQALVALMGTGVSVGCIFGADEELGGFTTTWMVEQKGYRPRKMVLVLDSSYAKIGYATKGQLMVRATLKGKGGHSSAPWRCEDLVTKLSAAVVKIREEWYRRHPLAEGPDHWSDVLTPTVVKSEGTALNRIPSEVWVNFNLRSVRAEAKDECMALIRELTGGEVEVIRYSPPCVSDGNDPLVARLRQAMAKELGREIPLERMPFATDARCFVSCRVPVVNIGHDHGDSHAATEWATADSIGAVTRYLVAFLQAE